MRSRSYALATSIMASIAGIVAVGACSTFESSDDASSTSGDSGMDAPVVVPPGDSSMLAPDADAAEADAAAPKYTILAKGYGSLEGVAANETTVFFLDSALGKVHGVALDGKTPAYEFANDTHAPTAIEVIDDVVVWSDYSQKTLSYKGLTGGTIQTAFLVNGVAPVAITVGGPDRVVVAALSLPGNSGDIQQYTRILQPGAAATTRMTFTNPFDVAVVSNTVYWTESGAGGNVWKGTIDVEGGTVVYPGETDCQSIAADALGVYWARPGSSVVRAVLPGTSPGVINLSTTENRPYSLAADGKHVYWLTMDGKLRRSNRDVGLPVETLAKTAQMTTKLNIQAIALTSKYVVWITADGQVLRQDK